MPIRWICEDHANNDTALRYAARSGHLNVVKYLAELGADVNTLSAEQRP